MTKRNRSPKRRAASPEYLENAAFSYLERFATTRAHLSRILSRKLYRRGLPPEVEPETGERWVEEVVHKMVDRGLVDDRQYAEARAESLLRRGASLRLIRGKLAQKGVPTDLIDAAVATLGRIHTDVDLKAAIAYVRRRRLGPARPIARRARSVEEGRRQYEKDLASLARAGFSYDLAKTVLASEDEGALTALEPDEG